MGLYRSTAGLAPRMCGYTSSASTSRRFRSCEDRGSLVDPRGRASRRRRSRWSVASGYGAGLDLESEAARREGLSRLFGRPPRLAALSSANPITDRAAGRTPVPTKTPPLGIATLAFILIICLQLPIAAERDPH